MTASFSDEFFRAVPVPASVFAGSGCRSRLKPLGPALGGEWRSAMPPGGSIWTSWAGSHDRIERIQMVDEPGRDENEQVPVPASVFASLPEQVKPLYRHWVSD